MEKDLEQRESNLIKIVLVGAESTGKTTLAKQLADHFGTVWVREYLREFSEEKLKNENKSVEKSDNFTIVKNQLTWENEAVEKANRFLFCDTNYVQTMIYSELYFGGVDDFFRECAENLKYDLYLLTDIDVPWEEDGVRDAPLERERHNDFFKKRLEEMNKPFIEISGSEEQRKQKAIQIANDLELPQKRGFTPDDLAEFSKRGITLSEVLRQLEVFERGIPFVNLDRPATINDGILRFSDNEIQTKADFFDKNKDKYNIQKFVPASGAASRMFQFLSKFLSDFNPETDTINAYINHNRAYDLTAFFVGLEKFPFYKEVKNILKTDFPDYKLWSKDKYYYTFVAILLSDKYLNYCNLPKGVLPFHKNDTPIKEHLKEAFLYAGSKVHFTVSEEHLQTFNKKVQMFGKNSFEIGFSFQKKSTDTIAVHLNKTPFRKKCGNILFRQSGHGALLENLNDLDSDIVFIKNIDNVSSNYFDEIILYKKALGGMLIELQQRIFSCLNDLEQTISDDKITEISLFAKNLNIVIPNNFEGLSKLNKIEFLKNKLNRPVRICGMVKNEGEPGGGPFWVKNSRGEVSLQIVEASQIDKSNEVQKQILEQSTHFNPVDLVCGIKNYKGEKFDLLNYRDNDTGFLTEKTKDGLPIIGYELPGLWNGAMADWISVFVEVSLKTFNPVKTVNDLLKPAHQ